MKIDIKLMIAKIFAYIWLTILTVVVLFPFFGMLTGSFKTQKELAANPISFPQAFTLDNYKLALFGTDFLEKFLFSVFLTVVSLAICLVVGSLAAYTITKLDLKIGKIRINNFLYILFIIGMLVPLFITVTPLMMAVNKFGLVGSVSVVVLIYAGTGQAFTIFILSGFIKGIPNEILDSAKIDGCSNFMSFIKIILPLLKGALGAISIILILRVWNDILIPLVFLQGTGWQTLTQATYLFQNRYGTNMPGTYAFVALQVIPVLIIYLLLQRFFIKGILAGAIKG